MTLSKLTTIAAIIAITLSTSSCIIHVGPHGNDDHDGQDYSSVFGGVDVGQNKRVNDVSSVNGNITIQDDATANDVDAVNGNIEIGNNVQVEDLSTVNGDIQVLTKLIANGDVSTVNGNIVVGEGSSIANEIATVNGDINLTNVKVGDDITTKNGSIKLTQNSVVEGNIEFESQHDSSWWSEKSREYNPPTLTIDSSSDVKGRIILRQLVILEIDNQELLEKVERRYKEQG